MPRHIPSCDYCIGCRLRAETCLCSAAPKLTLATRVLVHVHALDWAKASNTGHLVRLAIANALVHRYGAQQRFTTPSIETASNTWILFPGRGAEPLTEDFARSLRRPVTLIIPDGNWNQVRRMMARSPLLSQYRCVCLDDRMPRIATLRANSEGHHLSTFEAIARAAEMLEGPETGAQLLTFFREYLRRKGVDAWRVRTAQASPSEVNESIETNSSLEPEQSSLRNDCNGRESAR